MRRALCFVSGVIIFLGWTITPSWGASVATLPIEQCKLFGNNTPSDPVRYEDSGHIADWSKFLRPNGTLKTLVIPVDFSDVPAKTSITAIAQNISEVSDEIKRLSSGMAQLDVTVLDKWVRLPQTASFYMQTNWERKINDSIVAADPLVDFSEFDLVLIKVDESNLVVNVAGALPMWQQSLPDGIQVLRGAFLGTDYWTTIGQSVQMSVHEIMHVFGLPDLYMPNPDGTVAVGIYDLMSSFRPGFQLRLFGWHKWKLGWTKDSEVTCLDATQPNLIEFSSKDDENSIVVTPIGGTKVLVLERYINPAKASSPEILAYEVDSKTYVWRSVGAAGKVSPIQIVRPNSYSQFPCTQCDLNLGITLKGSQTFGSGNLDGATKAIGESLWISITPKGSVAKSFPTSTQSSSVAKSITLKSFFGTTTKVSQLQKNQIQTLISTNKQSTKFICTALIHPQQNKASQTLAKKRAKATCDFAKASKPSLSTWSQSKETSVKNLAGKIMVSLK